MVSGWQTERWSDSQSSLLFWENFITAGSWSNKHWSPEVTMHVGMEPSKARWEWHFNTFTPSLHLVWFCQLYTPQNSLHALSLFTSSACTQNCLLYIKDNPYLPCSEFHNIYYSNIYHTDPAHALHSFFIQGKPHLPCWVETTLQLPTT